MSTRREFPHNTPEQVREYIREALAITDEMLEGAPYVPLQEAIFTAAVNLISSKQIVFEQVQPLGIDLRGLKH